jgi:hypothetical protein
MLQLHLPANRLESSAHRRAVQGEEIHLASFDRRWWFCADQLRFQRSAGEESAEAGVPSSPRWIEPIRIKRDFKITIRERGLNGEY